MSENAAHKHVFKLLAPVQWEEAASRGTAEERQRRCLFFFFFFCAATGTQLLIYGVSMSWAGHVLPERPATGGTEGVKSEKGLSPKEKGGGSHIPTLQ